MNEIISYLLLLLNFVALLAFMISRKKFSYLLKRILLSFGKLLIKYFFFVLTECYSIMF